jgi:hypothetical protein
MNNLIVSGIVNLMFKELFKIAIGIALVAGFIFGLIKLNQFTYKALFSQYVKQECLK